MNIPTEKLKEGINQVVNSIENWSEIEINTELSCNEREPNSLPLQFLKQQSFFSIKHLKPLSPALRPKIIKEPLTIF